jgi:hypothetical protein
MSENPSDYEGPAVQVTATLVDPGIVYLLWSNKHQMWWKPRAMGYTGDIGEAGRYTQAEALRRVRNSALCGILGQVTCMVAAPEVWKDLL